MKSLTLCRLASLVVCFLLCVDTRAPAASHPLDALTAQEYWTIYDVLQSSGRVGTGTLYPQITLREPSKSDVKSMLAAGHSSRQALVVVKKSTHVYEAIVDITKRQIISWTELHGVQPNVTTEELTGVNDALHDDPRWQAAMRRRGITNFDNVNCVGASAGYFGTPIEQGRRLLRVGCFEHIHAFEPDARLIAGLVILWDVDQQKVLQIKDTGAVPMTRAASDYDPGSIPSRRIPTPLSIVQPLGPSFHVDGYQVSWQNWSFHFRIDRRVGIIVDNLAYNDDGRKRSILYEASLSEIFVPYMDPAEDWYWATYFDAGEFADGFSSSLERDSDCPENAFYFDQVYADERGLPWLLPRAACLFERYSGDIAWRHTGSGDPVESRRRRDLVLRTVATFSNYDYVFDWVFRQDGAIDINIGATGINELTSVSPGKARPDAYGRLVADDLVAPNHDHFFCFRLNFALDGSSNSFVRDRLVPQRLPAGSERKSIWTVESAVAQTEQQAKLRIDFDHPELWRVTNPHVMNSVGYAVGYQIVPGENTVPLLSADDYPQLRAGFTDYNLWITPYAPDEMYAAGSYPTQSKGGDGLPSWTRANRSIADTDIVVWYTMGFHHVPRTEDFPVMPTTWIGFELRPYNFFSRNPAIDLPR